MRQTFKWFRHEKVELPVNRFRYGRCELRWQIPRLGDIADVLRNSIFAGAYVCGRRQREMVIVDGRGMKRDGAPGRAEQRRVVLRDHHPGHIAWEIFEENQQMIRRNNMREGDATPAARSGLGLLMWLRCGRCGRKLHVRNWGKGGTAGRYLCVGDSESGGSYCLSCGSTTRPLAPRRTPRSSPSRRSSRSISKQRSATCDMATDCGCK